MPRSLPPRFQSQTSILSPTPIKTYLPAWGRALLQNQTRQLLFISIALFSSACQTINLASSTPDKVETSTNLDVARAFLDDGRPDKAMYELRPILDKNPDSPMAQSLMGLSQLALRNPRKAVKHLEIAWKLEPRAQHALNLSSAYIENKDYSSAQKIITAGLRLKETPPYKNKERFYHNLGFIAELKGSPGAAEKAYLRALEENPAFYISRAKIAIMMEEKHKLEIAKWHWELARMSCAGCFEPIAHLAIYYQNKGESKKALALVQDFKKIEGINPAETKKATALESEIINSPSKMAVLPKNNDLR